MAIVVGDVHGNVEKVQAFLAYRPDELHIALGDYVDSFCEPPNRQIEALQLLLDSKAVLLWGNHDLHYLLKPPFVCTGFQYGREKQYQETIEANKGRFLAAYTVDGWLLSHAGVHVRLAKHQNDAVVIADRLNKKMSEYLERPYVPEEHGIFSVGSSRGGSGRNGGIFWFDFKRESGLADVKQIFGHTETSEPVVTENFVALDTTNNLEFCWLYDTEANELVQIDLTKRKPQNNQPGRICDLPEDEREPFKAYLNLKNCPLLDGVPLEEQDGYWPTDYRLWKAGLEARI